MQAGNWLHHVGIIDSTIPFSPSLRCHERVSLRHPSGENNLAFMGSLEADDGDIFVKNFEPFVSFLIFLSDFETMFFNNAWTLVTLYIIFVNFWSHLFENVFFIVIEIVLLCIHFISSIFLLSPYGHISIIFFFKKRKV